MAAPEPNTDPPHWFWRGVQSAIFYYVSCSPCIEFQHKKQRRQEAKVTKQETVNQQPGLRRPPRAFETNEEWKEELLMGPGPPKGWQPHPWVKEAQKKNIKRKSGDHKEEEAPMGRPSHERRISAAFENVKDTLRVLHPEKWNWKRYDREDEWLGGLSTTVTRAWDKLAASVGHMGEEPNSQTHTGRKRANTNESDNFDYTRLHHPPVNDLHPPVVSSLPLNTNEAAWMVLPPPSAAVMAGKKPPMEETETRKPLCVIGRRPPVAAPASSIRPHSPGGGTIETSSIEVWDATSVQSDESVDVTPPPRVEVKKRSPDMFATLETMSDTEMFKLRPEPRARPASWQFHYVIPSPSPLPSPAAAVHV
jgi:hypothetical protein